MQNEQDFIKLLNIFAEVLESNKDTPAGADNRILDAEGLAKKCFFHASSLLYLLRSTNIPEFDFSFFDPGSVNVIARAALESFLVFYYIFVEPATKEDIDFRYYSWLLADLLERQRYHALSPQRKNKQNDERNFIKELKEKITENPLFIKMSSKQQKALLNSGKWRHKSWTEIGISSGLSSVNAQSLYRFLCSHAHAGSMSVLQIRQAETAKQQKDLCGATMELVMITIAYFVKGYCTLFDKSKTYLNQNDEFKSYIKKWKEIGAAECRDAEVDWERIQF